MRASIQDGDRVLLTGATGYIGGLLLPRLAARGLRVRALSRSRARAARLEQAGAAELALGSVEEPARIGPALQGCRAAYYLVHAMDQGGGFVEAERRAARVFARAAREAGLERIVYLGGLGRSEGELSPHLASRQEVGRILREESGATVVELRASVVIGSGSLSFEMIRALVERLPVMVTPRWVASLAQPIAVEDALAYLLAALDAPDESRVLEIGGRDVLSYGDLMRLYARRRGLAGRWMIPVPVLTPRLSSLWLAFVTPCQARVGRRLIGSIRHDTVVSDGAARQLFPAIDPCGAGEAFDRALAVEERLLRSSPAEALAGHPHVLPGATGRWLYGRVLEARRRDSSAPPERAFAPIRRIGGRRGWYYGQWLWRLRGAMDHLAGGPGLRPGRRDPERPGVGEALDCWRVERYEPDRRLRLKARMRLPGRAWLEFLVEPRPGGGSRVHQTALFEPRGLAGYLYWVAIHPLHARIFAGMLREIVRRGESEDAGERPESGG